MFESFPLLTPQDKKRPPEAKGEGAEGEWMEEEGLSLRGCMMCCSCHAILLLLFIIDIFLFIFNGKEGAQGQKI